MSCPYPTTLSAVLYSSVGLFHCYVTLSVLFLSHKTEGCIKFIQFCRIVSLLCYTYSLFLVPYCVLLYGQLGCVTVSHRSVLPLFHDTDLCIIRLFRKNFNLHFTVSSPNPAMLISALYSSAGLQLCRIT